MKPDLLKQISTNELRKWNCSTWYLNTASENALCIHSAKPFHRTGLAAEKTCNLTVVRWTILKQGTTRQRLSGKYSWSTSCKWKATLASFLMVLFETISNTVLLTSLPGTSYVMESTHSRLTCGYRLCCQLCQVFLLNLLEEFGGWAPSSPGLSWRFLGLSGDVPGSRASTVTPGARMKRRGGQ